MNMNEIFEAHLVCSICYEYFIFPTSLNPCSHTFCEDCIFRWKKSQNEDPEQIMLINTCPVCRSPIKGQARSSSFENMIEDCIDKWGKDCLGSDERRNSRYELKPSREFELDKRKQDDRITEAVTNNSRDLNSSDIYDIIFENDGNWFGFGRRPELRRYVSRLQLLDQANRTVHSSAEENNFFNGQVETSTPQTSFVNSSRDIQVDTESELIVHRQLSESGSIFYNEVTGNENNRRTTRSELLSNYTRNENPSPRPGHDNLDLTPLRRPFHVENIVEEQQEYLNSTQSYISGLEEERNISFSSVEEPMPDINTTSLPETNWLYEDSDGAIETNWLYEDSEGIVQARFDNPEQDDNITNREISMLTSIRNLETTLDNLSHLGMDQGNNEFNLPTSRQFDLHDRTHHEEEYLSTSTLSNKTSQNNHMSASMNEFTGSSQSDDRSSNSYALVTDRNYRSESDLPTVETRLESVEPSIWSDFGQLSARNYSMNNFYDNANLLSDTGGNIPSRTVPSIPPQPSLNLNYRNIRSHTEPSVHSQPRISLQTQPIGTQPRRNSAIGLTTGRAPLSHWSTTHLGPNIHAPWSVWSDLEEPSDDDGN